jgi:hypothetical protein
MGTPAAAAWQTAVKLLQGCSTRQIDRREANEAVDKVYSLINKQNEAPRPPKAVLKMLVKQLQVR